MKLRNVLTLAILCGSYLLAGNSQAVEVSAATNEVVAVSYNNAETKFKLEDTFTAHKSNDDSLNLTGSATFKLYGGQYIRSVESYYVAADTDVVFTINYGRVNSKESTTKNKSIFSVISASNASLKYYAEQRPNGTAYSTAVDVKVSVAEEGYYYFDLASYSSSDSSTCNKINQLKVTYTSPDPVVEEPEVEVSSDKFSEQHTLSQLALSYSKTVRDDEVLYTVDETVLRYGAAISYVEWSALNVKGYGVAVAKNEDLNGATLTELLSKSDLSDSSVRESVENVKFAVGDVENVTRVNPVDDLFVEDAEGEYVLFNARIVVPEANYATGVNAVAYVVFEEEGVNKVSLLTEVVNDSVVNQASYYLANGEYNSDVTNVLELLAR